jgi:hypothetical protein
MDNGNYSGITYPSLHRFAQHKNMAKAIIDYGQGHKSFKDTDKNPCDILINNMLYTYVFWYYIVNDPIQ